MENELEVVNIRLVREPSLYSEHLSISSTDNNMIQQFYPQ